eukprot:GEMP01080704.1.p1 GENE.GEMP01080704.1~~GEMP01080704.1.p1  ORF type:complete len:133 (+),score=14.57 GEMP01080704.1:304-702(+)
MKAVLIMMMPIVGSINYGSPEDDDSMSRQRHDLGTKVKFPEKEVEAVRVEQKRYVLRREVDAMALLPGSEADSGIYDPAYIVSDDANMEGLQGPLYYAVSIAVCITVFAGVFFGLRLAIFIMDTDPLPIDVK